jgi:RNA polymerase sigma-70 factor (ECF subfamily)
VAPHGRPFAVAGFTVAHGRIVEIDVLADRARLRELDLMVVDPDMAPLPARAEAHPGTPLRP